MFFSKLRASSRTILSALLCVFIGLVIGFVVLFSLAYIDKNNTYQKNAEAYTSGQYPRADMLRAKKYLEGGEIGDDVLSHLKGQYGAGELTDVVNNVYTGFSDKLYSLYRMSDQDFRVSLLIKVRLQPKDIATLTAHSKESVASTRSRLYHKVFGKKGSTKDWDDFVLSI